MKILIVDDSPDSLAVAKARLAKECEEILCAGDGREGLEIAAREKPDIILLDLDMPDMSGYEVCRRLKADVELCMIPVLFLSGLGSAQDKVQGLDLGAIDYVTKPFEAFELCARVRAALRTKRLQDLLLEYAHIDPLTGLANRRALMERLESEWARIDRHQGRVAFIMADIDHFKLFNDTYGHQIGDKILQEAARIFSQQCRATDLPARYGGDEFAMLVPCEMACDAANLAERCRRAVADLQITFEGQAIHATTSFGVADSTESASPEQLIQNTDKALYQAKAAGRNVVHCFNADGPFRKNEPSTTMVGSA